MPRSRQTRRAGPTQQTRSAHTAPTRQAPPPQQQQQHAPVPHQQAPPATAPQARQPGLFGQMASTAAGVAVGSSIGHGISSMFGGGGGSSEPQEQQQQEQYSNQPMPAQYQNGNSCEADAKAFTQCLEATNNDMNSCSWYLEQLKACQRAAAPY